MGIEVPLTHRLDLCPVNLDSLAISQVLSDRADRLVRHHRNRLSTAVKGQSMLARVGRLDCDPISWPHRLRHAEMLVLVAVLPNPLEQKAWQLIVRSDVARANEPTCLRACTVCSCVHVLSSRCGAQRDKVVAGTFRSQLQRWAVRHHTAERLVERKRTERRGGLQRGKRHRLAVITQRRLNKLRDLHRIGYRFLLQTLKLLDHPNVLLGRTRKRRCRHVVG